MLQAKILPFVFVIIASVAFSGGRWSSKNTCHHTDLTHTALRNVVGTKSDELVQTSSAANVSLDSPTTQTDLTQASTMAALGKSAFETKPCNEACLKQRLNAILDQHGNEAFGENDRHSAYQEQIIQLLENDPALFGKFQKNLIDQIILTPASIGHKEETLLGIAYNLPQELRARLAWEMVQSYETPQTAQAAFELLPNDNKLRADVARIAMQGILYDGADESLRLLQSIVNQGSDLTETNVAADLEYYQKTLRDPIKRRASLSLLAQINPDSQALKDSLAASLDSTPQEIFSALNAIAAVSQMQATQAPDGDPSVSRLISANRERIQALANDTTAPMYVRIESMQLLMALDSTAASQ